MGVVPQADCRLHWVEFVRKAAQARRAQPKVLGVRRTHSQPERGRNSQEVPDGEEKRSAVDGSDPPDDAVRSRYDFSERLSARQPVADHLPTVIFRTNVFRPKAFTVAVVPFDQVRNRCVGRQWRRCSVSLVRFRAKRSGCRGCSGCLRVALAGRAPDHFCQCGVRGHPNRNPGSLGWRTCWKCHPFALASSLHARHCHRGCASRTRLGLAGLPLAGLPVLRPSRDYRSQDGAPLLTAGTGLPSRQRRAAGHLRRQVSPATRRWARRRCGRLTRGGRRAWRGPPRE